MPTVSFKQKNKLYLFGTLKANEKKRDPDPYQNVTEPENA
jgi:hypothetical protein